MKDGWLCDSILKTTHKPSPMSTAPAFSPGPCTTRGPVVGSFLRWTRELLYEQCSDHMTENMPSSVIFGSRPKISTIFLYSSSVRLCCAMRFFVITGAVTITMPSRYTSHWQRLLRRITICTLGLSTCVPSPLSSPVGCDVDIRECSFQQQALRAVHTEPSAFPSISMS